MTTNVGQCARSGRDGRRISPCRPHIAAPDRTGLVRAASGGARQL